MRNKSTIAILTIGVVLCSHHFLKQTSVSNPDSQIPSAPDISPLVVPRDGSWLSGTAVVSRVLPDDMKGRRHQRFIVETCPTQTFLIAHNIDLAPRIPRIAPGDVLTFRGKFETNSQGGVIHWTHQDPQGRISGGWIEKQGERFK